jgi:hypothetical protein
MSFRAFPVAPFGMDFALVQRVQRAMLTVTVLSLSASIAFAVLRHEDHAVAGLAKSATGPTSVYPVATRQLPVREWVRPMQAPNGKSWPTRSGYLPGYRVARRSGSAALVIDAADHPSDTLVRLYYVDGGAEAPVRTAFVAAGGQFTLSDLSSGRYEVRYRDLDSGALTRSQRFELDDERPDAAIKLQKAPVLPLATTAAVDFRSVDRVDPDPLDD